MQTTWYEKLPTLLNKDIFIVLCNHHHHHRHRRRRRRRPVASREPTELFQMSESDVTTPSEHRTPEVALSYR